MKSSSIKRLRLATRRDAERRLHEIYWLMKQSYTNIIVEGERILDPFNLYTTQEYLESDKLGLVLRETLLHGYNVPIIVVRGRVGRLYILDGHHRARVATWLRSMIKAYILNIPGYHKPWAKPITSIKTINPPITIDDPVLNTWRHIVNIISFIEQSHNKTPRLWMDKLKITNLYATQQLLEHSIPEKIIDEPILVYLVNNEYYVIDGHTRACLKLINGEESIRSLVFTIGETIGIIETAKLIGKPRISIDYCRKPLRLSR